MKIKSLSKFISLKQGLSSKYNRKSSNNRLNYDVLPYTQWSDNWKKIFYKEYPRFKKIPLEINKDQLNDSLLLEQLTKRTSSRNFLGEKINFQELSTLLFYSAGINPEQTDDLSKKRFFPSAGSRFPNEIYLLINGEKVDGLETSSYHFNVKRNCLEKMFNLENFSQFIHQVAIQEFIQEANFIICFSAVFDRSKVKYGERGYRYCLIEAGHIAQNLSLISSALRLKCCAIGGFSDMRLNHYLELDGESESIIYLLAIGK